MTTAIPIEFPTHADSNGVLRVFQCGRHVPFDVRRVFTVSAGKGDVRGDHAHKQCTQLLVCVAGKIRVTCDDGAQVTEYFLDSTGIGLLVPPGLWATEEYVADDAVLMVLCDRGYEAEDYIRNRNDFITFVGSKESR